MKANQQMTWWQRWKLRRGIVLLTPLGLVYVLGMLGVLSAAYHSGNNILFLIASMMFCGFVLQAIWGWWNLYRVRVRSRVDRYGREGEPLGVNLEVLAGGWRKAGCDLLLNGVIEPGGEKARLFIEGVPSPEQPAREEWRWLPDQMGVWDLHWQTLTSTYPAGLLRHHRYLTEVFRLIVLPSAGEVRWSGEWEGMIRSGEDRDQSRRGEGTELYSLRDYRWGDTRRQIHWKATARTGEVMVKEMQEDPTRRVVLEIDLEVWKRLTGSAFCHASRVLTAVGERLVDSRRIRGVRVLGERELVISDSQDWDEFLAYLVSHGEGGEPRAARGRLEGGRWEVRVEPGGELKIFDGGELVANG